MHLFEYIYHQASPCFPPNKYHIPYEPFIDIKSGIVSKISPEKAVDIWYVTEKVHGANIYFIIGNDHIYVARNSGIIRQVGKFYHGYDQVLDKYRDKFHTIQMELGGIVRIYGELVGGYYPSVVNKNISNWIRYTIH